MKKLVVTVSLILSSLTQAHADGFLCQGVNTGLNIKVFNHTQPTAGTRVPAIMVVSDPAIASDRKTVASFSSENSDLVYQGYGDYLATVDLTKLESSRVGENIAGTKLGYLATIKVAVDFYYTGDFISIKNGETVSGKVEYNKLNGEVLEEKLSCTRYLKN